MIKIENYEVLGWEHAIRGMRNPMNSWAKSDSFMCKEDEGTVEECHNCPKWNFCDIMDDDEHYILGQNDKDLMMRLAKNGPVHAKYRRMITVYVDITAPLYWWKEFDTYKIGTVANSCSTMHKIHAKEFVIEDFSTEHLTKGALRGIKDIIDLLNDARDWYLKWDYMLEKDKVNFDPAITCKKDLWWQMIQLLPSSYNQKRTIMLNYEVLNNIYHSRKNHKLDEWRELCKWIEELPYSEIITGERPEKEEKDG